MGAGGRLQKARRGRVFIAQYHYYYYYYYYHHKTTQENAGCRGVSAHRKLLFVCGKKTAMNMEDGRYAE